MKAVWIMGTKSAFLTVISLVNVLAVGSVDVYAQQNGDLSSDPQPFTNADDGQDGGLRTAPVLEDLPRPEGMPDYLVRLTRSECLEILKHSGEAEYVPSPGVTYQPGVDVRGNEVAPADLSGTTTLGDKLADEIVFELAINPLDYAGDPDLAERLSESRLTLGEITVDRHTGEVRLDGEVLSRRPPEELVQACARAHEVTLIA